MTKLKAATSTEDFDWCNYHNCDKHHSPSGPPKRIQPTYGELIIHKDKQARWDSYQTPRVTQSIKQQILDLLEDSETPEEHIVAHHLAVSAGMCYWSIKEGDWIWRN